MNILLHGCNGRMGQVISRLALEDEEIEIVCGIDKIIDKFSNPYPVYDSFDKVTEKIDLVIDFSNHSCIDSLLQFGLAKNVPLVICTTGFSKEEKEKMVDASKRIALLNSANMSLGVNLLVSLVKQAAEALYKNYDIEVIEKHHNQKLDSPSGTALMIADAMNSAINNVMEYNYGRHSKTEKRSKNEIGIHAVRGGSIVGEHEVIFAGPSEIIEIKHSALSRDLFAHGAIAAAKFLANKEPGFYQMKDLIKV